MPKNTNVLVIAPHADDEVLGCGGVIQQHVSEGSEVNVVVVCDRAGLADEQREQCLRAKKLLKYNKVHFLGMQDEWLFANLKDVICGLERLYIEHKPDIIYTCNDHDVNTDHQEVSRATNISCRVLQKYSPTKIVAYEIPSSTGQGHISQFEPNMYVEITSEQLDRKTVSFMCYENEIRDTPNPRNPIGLEIFAKYRGMQCNSLYAEAFKIKYEKYKKI